MKLRSEEIIFWRILIALSVQLTGSTFWKRSCGWNSRERLDSIMEDLRENGSFYYQKKCLIHTMVSLSTLPCKLIFFLSIMIGETQTFFQLFMTYPVILPSFVCLSIIVFRGFWGWELITISETVFILLIKMKLKIFASNYKSVEIISLFF